MSGSSVLLGRDTGPSRTSSHLPSHNRAFYKKRKTDASNSGKSSNVSAASNDASNPGKESPNSWDSTNGCVGALDWFQFSIMISLFLTKMCLLETENKSWLCRFCVTHHRGARGKHVFFGISIQTCGPTNPSQFLWFLGSREVIMFKKCDFWGYGIIRDSATPTQPYFGPLSKKKSFFCKAPFLPVFVLCSAFCSNWRYSKGFCQSPLVNILLLRPVDPV